MKKKILKGYKEVSGHIMSTFEKKKGSKYPFMKLDGAIVKRLLSLYSEFQIMALWDLFLSSDRDWETSL